MRRALVLAVTVAVSALAAGVVAAAPAGAGAASRSAGAAAPRTLRFAVNLVFPLVGGPCGYRAAKVPGGADLGCVEDADVKALAARLKAQIARLSDDGKGGTFSEQPYACVTAKATTAIHTRRAGSYPNAPLSQYPFIHLVSGIQARAVAPAGPAWKACAGA